MRRLGLGVVIFGGSFTLIGFVAGLWLAALTGTAQGQGLAAGAIVLFWGLAGALLGLVAALLLYPRLSARALRALMWMSAPAGLLIAVLILLGLQRSRTEMQAHLAEAYDRLPAFQLELVPGPRAPGGTSERFSADGERRVFETTIDGRVCSAKLQGEEAVRLLTALRGAEGVLYHNADPCAGHLGAPAYRLRFRIDEALPPQTIVDVSPSEACLDAYTALGEPFAVATEMLKDAGGELTCSAARR